MRDDYNPLESDYFADDPGPQWEGDPVDDNAPETPETPVDDFGVASEAPGCEALPVFSMASLDGVEIPRRQWIVDGWLPCNAVTLIAGGGGVGKSLMTQQWLTAISLGINWLGTQTTAAVPTLFINCEDEADEIARRNKDIAAALHCRVSQLRDAHALSRAGELGNDLGTFDNDRNFKLSAFFHQIEAAAMAISAKVVGLDNVAHLFTGNENVRGEVTQFMNACTRLAMHIGGSVVLLGHPAKVEGSQYSGSTSWENAVRSRLFLQRPDDKDGQEADPNERILTRGKANYAAKDEALRMVWHLGAFVEPSEVPEEATPEYSSAGRHNALFLECLAECTAKQRAVSHNSRASNYAPKLFAQMPAGRHGNIAIFAAAMERLIHGDIIKIEQELWLGKSRHPVIGIARVG